MHLKRMLFIVSLFCLYSQLTFSQQAYIEIKGRVADAQTNQPLQAVNVAVNRSGMGTITNGNGDFQLQVPATLLKDTLRISYMGYQVKYLPVSATQQGGAQVITLEPASLALKEVVVEAKDPMKLIQSAIRKIGENYIDKPHQLRGFYRATTTRDQDYMQLSEAVFDIFNKGYASSDNNQLYLVRARYIKDEEASHGLDLGMKPSELFEYDIVKDIRDNKIFSPQGLKDHYFSVRGVVDFKGIPAYEIEFDERDGVKKSLYRGRFYLDRETLAFLKIQCTLSPKGLPYASYGDVPTKALMSILDIHITPRQESINVEYQKVGDHWVLGNVITNTALNFRSSRKHYNFTTTTKVDYIVTSVDTTKQSPDSDGKHLGNNKLIEFQTTPLDAAFWHKNTIVLPDFDAEAVANMLKAKNANRSLKKRCEDKLKTLPADPALRIDSMLSYYYQKGQFNGTALVKNANGIILSKSYGYADKARQLPADSNTLYRIGSLSKSFTSIVILQLVQEGKLQLTDPVKKILPDYANGDITISQLLSHQSGVPNYTNNDAYLTQIMHKPFTLPELVKNFCSDSLEFPPGTQFHYSNSGYVILACIAETICKQPFPQVLKERIFIPAGMHDTYAGNDTPAVSKNAVGYLYGTKEPAYNTINTLGAGGVTSTSADLLRWSAALSASQLLNKASMDTMWAPHAEYTDWDAFYGYGWMIDQKLFDVSKDNHRIIYHPGTDFGFYSMFAKQEDKGNVIILLNNTGDFPRFDLTDMILTQVNQ